MFFKNLYDDQMEDELEKCLKTFTNKMCNADINKLKSQLYEVNPNYENENNLRYLSPKIPKLEDAFKIVSEFLKQSTKAQVLDTEAPDRKAPDTESSNTESSDTEGSDTKAPDTKVPDTEAPDTDATDTKSSDAEGSDRDDSDTVNLLSNSSVYIKHKNFLH